MLRGGQEKRNVGRAPRILHPGLPLLVKRLAHGLENGFRLLLTRMTSGGGLAAPSDDGEPAGQCAAREGRACCDQYDVETPMQ